MNSSRVVAQQVVAELAGKKTYRPLVTLTMVEGNAGRSDSVAVQDFAFSPKSLQVLANGTYTLRIPVNGEMLEYAVRVANKKLCWINLVQTQTQSPRNG